MPTPRLPRLGGAIDRIRSAGRRVRYAISDAAYWVGNRLRGAFRWSGDALIPDRLAAGVGRIGFSFRRGLVRIAELLRRAGLAARSWWSAIPRAWGRLSPQTRRLIAGVVLAALLGAGIWLAVVPNLPCQFPAGDRCPPPDDAAELVPADALAYLHTNLDSDTEQAEEASEIARNLPVVSSQLLGLLPLPGGGGVDFASDLLPWLGGEVALAYIAGQGGAPEQVYLLEAADEEGAERFARGLTGSDVSTSDRAGVEIRVGERGVASAVTGGFLVVGTEVAVQRVIDTQGEEARSLADSEIADAVADGLPDNSLAQAYVSEDGVQRLLTGNRGPLSTLEIFVNFDATVGAGAALVASEDGVEIAIHSELDPERVQASPGFFDAFVPFDPSIPEELAPRTVAYLGLSDAEASVEQLVEQAQSDAPGLVVGYEEFAERLQKAGKVSLEGELLPLLAGEAAFVIQPPEALPGGGAENQESEGGGGEQPVIPQLPGFEEPAPGAPPPEDVAPAPLEPEGIVQATGIPYLTFIGTDVDPEAATGALAKLQAPLAQALSAGESGQTPTFEQRELDGIQAFSASISPAVDLTYAIFDGQLVVATQPEGVVRLATGPGGLTDAPPFERVSEDLPDEPALLVYFNLRELLGLFERAGLASDPAYASFAPELQQLFSAALAVERGQSQLDTTLRVALAQPGR